MKTLIIVILILVCVLMTPLSLKRMIDRKNGKGGIYASFHPGTGPLPDQTNAPENHENPVSPGESQQPDSSGSVQQPDAPAPTASASSSSSQDLQSYLIRSIERIVKDSIRITSDDPAEAKFLVSFAAAAGKAAARRRRSESAGEHIPPFLIASITDSCNLHCAGCYAHARDSETCLSHESQNASEDPAPSASHSAPSSASQSASHSALPASLSADKWNRIFTEAGELGVCFIFLVGGEPLMRRDVIKAAARHQNILFPIITNGLLMDDDYLDLLDHNRNLLPVISIEGDEFRTDARRGAGIYNLLLKQMQKLADLTVPFGVSITVTTENLLEVTGTGFADTLREHGCRMILYIEYVSVNDAGASNEYLEPGEADRALLDLRLQNLRKTHEDMLFLSFPGDETAFGGCLAAGRGFFHISASGNAEPCPFAPYSDVNLRDHSIREALKSGLFTQLDARGMLQTDHTGGCALSHKGNEISRILETPQSADLQR